MQKNTHDENTRIFYQASEVAREYDGIRFKSKGGKRIDAMQKELLLSLLKTGDWKGKKVLEIGCGTGRFTHFFSQMGADMFSLDVSLAMISKARELNQTSNFVNGDAIRLPFKDQFCDMAFSVNVFNHLASYETAIDELCRVAKKVIIGIPNRHSLLLMGYLARYLRGYNKEYSGYTIKKYKDKPVPYSIYFTPNEIIRILKKNGFNNIHYSSRVIVPFMPFYSLPLMRSLDKELMKRVKRGGTFLAIYGQRETKGSVNRPYSEESNEISS